MPKFSNQPRENQLQRLKEGKEDLLTRILFWVSDCLCYKTSKYPMEEYPHDDDNIHGYIGSFYFSQKEARRINNLKMEEDGLTLEGALQRLVHENQAVGLCTSHHLYPLLCEAFGLDRGMPFNKKPFQKEKQAWIKQRKNELGTVLAGSQALIVPIITSL